MCLCTRMQHYHHHHHRWQPHLTVPFPSSWNLLFSHQPNTGHAGRAALLSGLSCPGVGNYEDDSGVHFVMLSLTYELWAIFQNFSQGGHSHLQGLGGCSRGARGGGTAYLLQTNQMPTPRSTHSMSHATFIAVLGVSVLKGLPVLILVRFFLAGRRIVNLFWSWPVLVL